MLILVMFYSLYHLHTVSNLINIYTFTFPISFFCSRLFFQSRF